MVLNHFTDFIDKPNRDLSGNEFSWNTYPLKSRRIKDFFLKIDRKLLFKIKHVLNKLSDYKNITKIELFNEIDLVNINKHILIEWIKQANEALFSYKKRFNFYVSVANQQNLTFFQRELSIPVDIHTYNFPFEYAFKNIEYFKNKLDENSYIGEYAKFSHNSFLTDCGSKAYFCSGLWGSYFLRFSNSPLHWWWKELLNNKDYLKIIETFQKNKPKDFTPFNSFEIKTIKLFKSKQKDTVKHKKVLYRLKNLIIHPSYIKVEYCSILKYINKIILSQIDKSSFFVRGFEDKENIWFYCEPKNCQRNNIKLCVKTYTDLGYWYQIHDLRPIV